MKNIKRSLYFLFLFLTLFTFAGCALDPDGEEIIQLDDDTNTDGTDDDTNADDTNGDDTNTDDTNSDDTNSDGVDDDGEEDIFFTNDDEDENLDNIPPEVVYENVACNSVILDNSAGLTPSSCVISQTPGLHVGRNRQGEFVVWVTKPIEDLANLSFEIVLSGRARPEWVVSFIRSDMDENFPISMQNIFGALVPNPGDKWKFAENVRISSEVTAPSVFNVLPAQEGRERVDIGCYAVAGSPTEAKVVCSYVGNSSVPSPSEAETANEAALATAYANRHIAAEAARSRAISAGKTAEEGLRAAALAASAYTKRMEGFNLPTFKVPLNMVISVNTAVYENLQDALQNYKDKYLATPGLLNGYNYSQEELRKYIEGVGNGRTERGSFVRPVINVYAGMRYHFPVQRFPKVDVTAFDASVDVAQTSADGLSLDGNVNDGYQLNVNKGYENMDVLKFAASIDTYSSAEGTEDYRFAWFRTDFAALARTVNNEVEGKRLMLQSALALVNGGESSLFTVTPAQPAVIDDPRSPIDLPPLAGVSVGCTTSGAGLAENVDLNCEYVGRNVNDGLLLNIRIVEAAKVLKGDRSIVEIMEPLKLVMLAFPNEGLLNGFKAKLAELNESFLADSSVGVSSAVFAEIIDDFGGKAKKLNISAGMKYH